MADISGGGLSFKSVLDNEQLISAINETMRRVQGLSDAVVDSGDVFDKTTKGMALSMEDVRNVMMQIGDACAMHEKALDSLEQEYARLGAEMDKAIVAGRDDELNALGEQRNAIQGEITVRKQLLSELREQSDILEATSTKMQQNAQESASVSANVSSLRTKIRNLKEEMAALIADGIDEQSEAYKRLEAELGRLMDIQGDIQAQGSVLANDEAQFQGIITGLGGVAGGFTAAQGAMALFAGENENLEKIMLKVQSLMSITMGLQQVAQALNKDSAFQLVTLNGLKSWWNDLLDVGRGKQVAATAATIADTAAETANTVATGANAAAQNAQTGAAVAGTSANISLAGAFRMVGAAIKSIPGVGWIIAAVGALIGVVGHFVSNAKKAKKATDDWYKSVSDECYKPIAAVKELSAKWSKLGDDFKAKQHFIESNKDTFDKLGVAVRGVTDAENILIRNKDKFIEAQVEKAKSMVLLQQAQDKVKSLMIKQQEHDAMSDTTSQFVQTNGFGGGYWQEGANTKKADMAKEIENLKTEINKLFTDAADAESKGGELLKEAGIKAVNTYKDGTLGAIEQAIQLKRESLKNLSDPQAYQKTISEIEKLQKQADTITGTKSTAKDPFLTKLEKYKTEYRRFMQWMNSGDDVLVKSANQEFASLLKQGATYIDYLKNQRDQILAVDVANRTKEQNNQLRMLNDAISEETKKTVLDSFNTELNDQMAHAKSAIEMLKFIEQKRKELSNDGTDIDAAKSESLDDAEKNATQQLEQETETLLNEYASYAAQKKAIDDAYQRDYETLMKKREKATSDAERAEIDAVIANRKNKRNKDVNAIGAVNYDQLIQEFGSFEEKKQAIIDEYEEKRKAARMQGNEELVKALDDAQAKAISSMATEKLTGSEMWSNLFSNLDEMAASDIEILIQQIESQFNNLSISFDPSDLAEIRNQLNTAKDILVKDNPFKQMGQAIKEILSSTGKESTSTADSVKKSWTKLAKSTASSFDFVANAVNQCEPLKDIIGDVGATALSSLQSVVMASISVATAVKTAEKSSVILAIIQAVLVAIQAIYALFQAKDKQIQAQIQEHQTAVNRLQNAYAQLSWEIDRALGGEYYKLQRQAIQNLEEQKRHIKEAQELEEGRKKADQDKVDDFAEQQKELDRKIQDTWDEIAEDILQTNGKEFADELGDALVSAFEKGEDAAKVFEETVNDVLKNAIINQLKRKFLETQLQGALDKLMNDMGQFNSDGEFIFDGLSGAEIADFKDKIQNAADNYQEALNQIGDIFKAPENMQDTSLSGVVKGVSEQTAEIVAGQMNAMRINQMEAIEIMRQQLMILNTIAVNTSYNRYLVKLERILAVLEKNQAGDSLRSHGLS